MNLFGRRPSCPIRWPALHALLEKGNFAASVDALSRRRAAATGNR